jgi:hypothetical protein
VLDDFNAAHLWQTQIDQGYIGMMGRELLDGFSAIGGLGYDFDALDNAQESDEALADDGVIFDYKDSDYGRCHHGSLTILPCCNM